MKPRSFLIRLSLSALALTAAHQGHADTVFGVYAGAGIWQSEYSGDIGNPATSADNLGIGNITYPSGTTVATDFDLSYTDAALYYELLDNWLTLDLGVTLRKYSGYLKAESSGLSDNTDIDLALPLAYGHMQFDLPLTGFFAGFEGNYISYDGNDLADYSAKIGYSFDSALDIGVEVGYRALTVNIDDDEVQTNLDIKGPYAAAIFHF